MSKRDYYSPVRHSHTYEFKIGAILDTVFFIVLVVIIIKLFIMLGH